MGLTRILSALACALLPLAAPAQGLNLEDVVQAEVLPGWRTRAGDHMAALRLRLAPGWKTYWRAPGDAGIPPVFTWDGSENLGAVTPHWPRPKIFFAGGYRSLGYEGELVLPLSFAPARPGMPVKVRGSVQLGICEDICIPVTLELSADLAGKGRSDPAIQAALAAQPTIGSRAGVRSAVCQFQPISDGLRLTAEIQMPRLGRGEAAAVEAGDPRIWVSPAEVTRRGDRLVIEADLVPPRGQAATIDRASLRFTILGARQAVDVRGCSAR